MAPPPASAEANRPKNSGRGLKMMSKVTADLPAGHPGCLVAAYCYQDRLFDRKMRDLYTSAMLGWRRRFRERLELIVARYPPRALGKRFQRKVITLMRNRSHWPSGQPE
jgi:hypothetical protein